MSKDRATIEAELAGAAKFEADAKKVNRALGDVKKTAGEGVAAGFNKATAGVQVFGAKVDAVRGLLNPSVLLGGTIGAAVTASVGAVVSYLNQSGEKAKTFSERTAITARQVRASLGEMRMDLRVNEQTTLQSADAQQDYLAAVEQSTYGGADAAKSLETVAQAATLMGRKAADMAPFAASIQTLYGHSEDVGVKLEELVAKADRLSVNGGPKALLDTVAALRPALANVSQEAGVAGDKLLAMAAVLQGRMRPGQAQAVTSGAVGMIQGRWMDIERTLGHQVLDKDGNVADPVQTIKEIRAVADKKYGKGESRAKRFAMLNEFGPQLGSAILNMTDDDFEKMELEAVYKPRASTQKSFDRMITSSADARAQQALYRGEEGERLVGTPIMSMGRRWDELWSGGIWGHDLTQHGGGGGGGQGAPTINISAESAERIGAATANKMKDATLNAKLEVASNPNAPQGN